MAALEHRLPKRVLVTGGSGFVGGVLLEQLRKLGVQCVGIGRSNGSCQRIEALGAQSVLGDMHSQSCLSKALEGADAVVHLAARKSGRNFADFERDNVQGTQLLLDMAAKAGVKRFVNLSTGSLVAALDPPQPGVSSDVDLPPASWSPYLLSKWQAEQAVVAANGKGTGEEGSGMATLSLRPCLIWGGAAPFHDNLLELPVGFVFLGGGRFAYSTIHIDNLVHAIVLTLACEQFASPSGALAARAWFVNDGEGHGGNQGEMPDFCSFITQLQAALGAKEGGISLPFAPALGLAQALDGLWGMVNRGQSLNLQAGVRMFGQSIAPSDAQFRQASGYRPVVSVAQGLKRLKAANER